MAPSARAGLLPESTVDSIKRGLRALDREACQVSGALTLPSGRGPCLSVVAASALSWGSTPPLLLSCVLRPCVP